MLVESEMLILPTFLIPYFDYPGCYPPMAANLMHADPQRCRAILGLLGHVVLDEGLSPKKRYRAHQVK